jgi:hypothetical protein
MRHHGFPILTLLIRTIHSSVAQSDFSGQAFRF